MIRNWIDYKGKDRCILIWGQDGKAKLLDIFSCLRKNKYTVSQGAPPHPGNGFCFKTFQQSNGRNYRIKPDFALRLAWPTNLPLTFTHGPIDQPAPVPGAAVGWIVDAVRVIHAPQGQVVIPISLCYSISIQVSACGGWQIGYRGRRNFPTA